MSRPLIVTDCDEVLLHMVVPFRDWLASEHRVVFDFGVGGATFSMTHHGSGMALTPAETWPLLRAFFATEMHRQYPISGAIEAIGRLEQIADVVVLTNIGEQEREGRMAQLAAVGVHHRVVCNQGGKGPALAKLVAEFGPSAVVFIDDIASNHESVAEIAPDTWRLQFVGEPELAVHIKPSRHAHARIDSWAEAEAWVRDHAMAGIAAGPVPA